MHAASILIALVLIWARREWASKKEPIELMPVGEPRPTPTPPPYGISI